MAVNWQIASLTATARQHGAPSEQAQNKQNFYAQYAINSRANITVAAPINTLSVVSGVQVNAKNLFIHSISISRRVRLYFKDAGGTDEIIVEYQTFLPPFSESVLIGFSDRALAATMSRTDFLSSCFGVIPLIVDAGVNRYGNQFPINQSFDTKSGTSFLNVFFDKTIDSDGLLLDDAVLFFNTITALIVGQSFDSIRSQYNIFINAQVY